MSDHLKAVGIKTLALVIFSAILTPMFTDLPASYGILLGIVISIVAYVLGDLVILPASNNTVATVSDIIVAALLYWSGIRLLGGRGLSAGELVFFGVLVGVSEWFLHKYISRFVLSGKRNTGEEEV